MEKVNNEMENTPCDGDHCSHCSGCDTVSVADDDASDEQNKLPVAARDYTNEIDAYMSYLASGAFGKLYKKDAKPDDEVYSPTGSSMREHMWVIFSTVVGLHLREYAVPQYGDAPTDELSSWNAEQCIKQIAKYAARFNTNSRGEEENLTDLLKVAHYASEAWLRLRGYDKLFSVELPDEATTDLPLEGELTNVE